MAQLSNQAFYDKWVPLLADNVFQDIDGKRFEELLADMRDSFASLAATSSQPVAPAVNFDPVLRQLTATHVLGISELEYTHNNGGFTAYAPVQVDDLGHGQGEWRFRVKAATGRNASQVTDSPQIVVKGTGNAAGPGKIKAVDISDSTEAGRALLMAADVDAQRTLLDNFVILAGQYGIGQPRFEHVAGADGLHAYLLRGLASLATPAAPAAPTAGQVDDTGDVFSFLPPIGYSFAQLKVAGLPQTTGAEWLSAANSYVQNGRVYVRVVGAVAKGGLAVYVGASGNMPDGKVLTNDIDFTANNVVPAVPGALAVEFTVDNASLSPNDTLGFAAKASGGTAPYQHSVQALNRDTGAVTVLGTASTPNFTGTWPKVPTGVYLVTDAVRDAAGASLVSTARRVVVAVPGGGGGGAPLTAATTSKLGGVIIGAGLTVQADGTTSVTNALSADQAAALQVAGAGAANQFVLSNDKRLDPALLRLLPFGDYCYMYGPEDPNFPNTFGLNGDGSGHIGNNYGFGILDCHFGDNHVNNKYLAGLQSLYFGSNHLDNEYGANIVGSYFYDDHRGNRYGNNLTNSSIGAGNKYNVIGDDCSYLTTNANVTECEVGANCYGIIFGANCKNVKVFDTRQGSGAGSTGTQTLRIPAGTQNATYRRGVLVPGGSATSASSIDYASPVTHTASAVLGAADLGKLHILSGNAPLTLTLPAGLANGVAIAVQVDSQSTALHTIAAATGTTLDGRSLVRAWAGELRGWRLVLGTWNKSNDNLRPMSAKLAFNPAAPQAISGGDVRLVQLSQEQEQVGLGLLQASQYRIRFPRAGNWKVGLLANVFNMPVGSYVEWLARVNGTLDGRAVNGITAPAANQGKTFSAVRVSETRPMQEGDYVELVVYSSGDGTIAPDPSVGWLIPALYVEELAPY